MPRKVAFLLTGLLAVASVWSQGPGPMAPVWSLVGPGAPVVPGQPFTVTAQVRVPVGYYQDAGSPFLAFEVRPPAKTTAGSSGPTVLRAGKPSYSGTFTLTRTLVLPVTVAPGARDLTFDLGWQICQVDGVCLLPGQAVQTLAINVTQGQGSDLPGDFGPALLGAFLGGLLLNLMPCVFPVLALKALGLVASAGATRRQRRRDALAFGLGSFGAVFALGLVIAGVAALGQRLEWGFPFQQPGFVWALVLIFWALTLHLAGFWTWSGSPFSLSVEPRGSGVQSLAGGAFLVVAAAPCTAPLLGPALGFALARPPVEIPVFFAAMGLGLSAPLVALQAFPGWARFLPRPGSWMTVVERVAAVLLAATVAYLFGVFLVQTGGDRWVPAVALLALAAGSLVLGFRLPQRTWARPVAGVLALVVAVGSWALVAGGKPSQAPTPQGWQAYSAGALSGALDGGKTVLVDATAAWCATCQVNEAGILNRPDVVARLGAAGVLRLRADYTNPDPAIRDWLASVNRAGLPVYALYRPGQPVILFPELLTDDNFARRLPGLLGTP